MLVSPLFVEWTSKALKGVSQMSIEAGGGGGWAEIKRIPGTLDCISQAGLLCWDVSILVKSSKIQLDNRAISIIWDPAIEIPGSQITRLQLVYVITLVAPGGRTKRAKRQRVTLCSCKLRPIYLCLKHCRSGLACFMQYSRTSRKATTQNAKIYWSLTRIEPQGIFSDIHLLCQEIYCIQFPSYVYVAVNFLFQLIFVFSLFQIPWYWEILTKKLCRKFSYAN